MALWWVNGNLLQEGLCHTQVCCTQKPYPWGSPLLTRTTTGDAQIQFCLSLCGVPGSWCTHGLFEPSEHLWWERGLIQNANLPLLPSCWGFSFALGHGVSLHSCSSAYLLNGVSLTLAVGDLLSAAGSRALMEVISIPCKLIYVGEGWGSRPDMCKAPQNSVF